MHDTIPVSEVMLEDVVTVSPDAAATEAARLLRDEGDAVVLVDDLPPTARERDATAAE